MRIAGKLVAIVASTVAATIALSSIVEVMRLKSCAKEEMDIFAKEQRLALKATLKSYMDIVFEQLEANYRNAHQKDAVVIHYGKRLQNVVDMASSIVKENLARAKKGEFSLADAQSLSMQMIKAMRFDNGSGYVWIQDAGKPFPKMLMHPTIPSLDGTALDSPQSACVIDGQRKNLFVKLVEDTETSPTNDAYVMYLWPKPMGSGVTSEQPKLSYVKAIKEWGWLLGAGVYIDDVVDDAKADSLTQLQELSYDSGEGYFWITDTGKPFPTMLMHSKDHSLNGKLLDSPSYNCIGEEKANFPATCVRLCEKSGEGYLEYSWPKNGKDASGGYGTKLSYVKLFPQYGWVVGTGLFTDKYIEAPIAAKKAALAKQLEEVYLRFILVGVALTIASAVAALVITKSISGPIAGIVKHSELVAIGDLTHRMAHSDRNDETGALTRSINTMTERLGSLVGQVQRSTVQIVSSATEIAASAKEQESIINEFGATTNEIVSSTKEISATSQQLVKSMNDLASVTSRTAGLASEGHSGLSQMEETMEHLAAATDSISTKLSVINEKANNINNVVTTITKVADQTNLLSLNAAIEAEKAGEFGKGFSVVAREVRRLADQTAVATLDITRMVKEMQSAVSSGVMEMDKFSDEVRHGVKETSTISSSLEKIIEDVQSLPPVFNNVIDGMSQQADGAQQISESMVQLNDAMRQTSESLRELNEAIAQLNMATQGLQKEVTIFKVK